MRGYFKCHRCLLEKPIFHNEKLLKVFIWCLCKATHKAHDQLVGRQAVSLKPGQFVTGRHAAGKELNMAPSTAWDYLKVLETNSTIDIQSNSKYSLVTLVNWEFYQVDEGKPDSKSDSNPDNKSTANQHKQECKELKELKELKRSMSETFSDDSLEMKICKYMTKKILESYPGAKLPTSYLKWCQTFDRLMRIDGRTKDDIRKVIDWIYQDEFWCVNIRSPEKLREKWDTIWLHMNRKKKEENKPTSLADRILE